jgi:hypothetical protein
MSIYTLTPDTGAEWNILHAFPSYKSWTLPEFVRKISPVVACK